jgi:hypothetical protein
MLRSESSVGYLVGCVGYKMMTSCIPPYSQNRKKKHSEMLTCTQVQKTKKYSDNFVDIIYSMLDQV